MTHPLFVLSVECEVPVNCFQLLAALLFSGLKFQSKLNSESVADELNLSIKTLFWIYSI